MMSCIFRPFVAENRAFPALWSWHSPTDSADEASFEPADAHDAETDDPARRVHALHHGVVLGFLLITGDLRKSHFKIIGFHIEPDFYFIGQKSSPALGLSVRRLAIPARG